jgi:hypothetical protein
MRVWKLELYAIVTKKQADFWEHWATRYVAAETLEEAINKLIEKDSKNFYKVRVDAAELLCEVDIE